MRKRYSTVLLPLVLLLFVGSSGCTKSDILDVMEVLGGSQGITAADIVQKEAPKAWGGGSTGDKDKDALLDTADTMQSIKKAAGLEDEAKTSLGQKPPDLGGAVEKLEEAIKVRPNDWSLKNQRDIATAEGGWHVAGSSAFNPTQYCPEDKRGDISFRCAKSTIHERAALIEASKLRQKNNDQLIACETHLMASIHYSYMSRLTEDDLEKLGYKPEDSERFLNLSRQAEAAQKSPGVTCRGQ